MTALENILVAIHLLGFGALFGGILIQAKDPVKKVNFLMRDGVGTTVVAGLILYIVDMSAVHQTANWSAKMGVMMLIGIGLLGVIMANLKKESISKGLWLALLITVVVNVGVATLWVAHTAH
jgi:hypothetical protein